MYLGNPTICVSLIRLKYDQADYVDTSLDVHSEVTGNVTFQDIVLAHERIELDMNTYRPLINIVK